MQKIRKLINVIKQNDMTDKSVIYDDDQDLEDKINDPNKKLRIYAKGKICILQITVI